jgi:hypothetical protein
MPPLTGSGWSNCALGENTIALNPAFIKGARFSLVTPLLLAFEVALGAYDSADNCTGLTTIWMQPNTIVIPLFTAPWRGTQFRVADEAASLDPLGVALVLGAFTMLFGDLRPHLTHCQPPEWRCLWANLNQRRSVCPVQNVVDGTFREAGLLGDVGPDPPPERFTRHVVQNDNSPGH